jgi:hypothetical protein
MTSLIINNINIPIPANFSLTLNFENPLFIDSAFNKTYGYSFQLSECPELNALFEHAERQNARNSTRKYSSRIYFEGVLLVNGHATIEQSNARSYNIYIQQEGFDFVEQLKTMQLRDLPTDVVELWPADATPTITEKRNAWLAHIQANHAQPETSGTVKFPRIAGIYEEDQDDLSQKQNPVFTGRINQYVMGQAYVNPNADNGTKPFGIDEQWLTTVAPIPRIETVLEIIINALQLRVDRNDVEQLEAFKRLLGFAGVVYDEYQNNGTINNNVHGRTYSINETLPINSLFHVFEILRDVFGCFFVFQNTTLNILLSNIVLNSVEINVTKYSTPEYRPKFIDKFNIVFSLPDFGRNTRERYFQDPGEPTLLLPTYFDLETNPEIFERKEMKVSFNLLKHNPRLLGSSDVIVAYNQFALPDTLRPEYYHEINVPNFSVGREKLEFIRSAEINNAETDATDRFHIFWYLGIRPSVYEQFDPSPGFFTINAFFSGIYQKYFAFDYFGTDPITFGDEALCYPDIDVEDELQRGLFETYHKAKIELTNGAKEVEKTLALPPHKIVEFAKWENPRHFIENPKGTFVGVIKKMSVTITANSMSPTRITYVSQTK